MGKSTAGLSLGDKERGLTHVVFFIVIPTAASAFYLKLLAGLTETFRNKEAVEKIMAETTQAGMWKALVKMTRPTIK